jgi:hypothetical protein
MGLETGLAPEPPCHFHCGRCWHHELANQSHRAPTVSSPASKAEQETQYYSYCGPVN